MEELNYLDKKIDDLQNTITKLSQVLTDLIDRLDRIESYHEASGYDFNIDK